MSFASYYSCYWEFNDGICTLVLIIDGTVISNLLLLCYNIYTRELWLLKWIGFEVYGFNFNKFYISFFLSEYVLYNLCLLKCKFVCLFGSILLDWFVFLELNKRRMQWNLNLDINPTVKSYLNLSFMFSFTWFVTDSEVPCMTSGEFC